MTTMPSPYRRTTIPIERIVGAAEIRQKTGVSPSTFERWRRDHGFPAPFLELAQGPLWDRQQVDEWLAAASFRRRRVRRA